MPSAHARQFGFGFEGKPLIVESLEVESAGDLAYEMGRYTLYAGDNDVDKGKYVLIWKHEAGQWRIHRDIVNSSRPA